MYSQNNEEEKIIEYFKGKTDGRLLDIGAFDGKIFSNTLRLVELGWEGVCVEPSPIPFSKMEALHKDNKKVVAMNVLIGPKNGAVDFFDSSGDAVSTTDLSHVDKWEKGSKVRFNKIQVESMTPESLLDIVGTHFDFVNVDTESTNLDTLKGLIVAGLRFELLCVEHDSQQKDIVAMFPKCHIIGENQENIILSYKEWM